ncbi:sensor histidine kinase, partial [Nocardia gipuzkoensis]
LDEVALVEPAAVATEIATIIDRVRAAGFTVHAEIELGAAELDAVTRLTVMRLVQESMTNVMKHADPADPVFATAVRERSGLRVGVRSGRPRAAHEAGHGIIGMRERVELVGGTLSVGPAGDGWEVLAWVPIG